MKVVRFVFAITILLAGIAFADKMSGVQGETMSEELVRKKWGNDAYTAEGFRSASMEMKARMAANMLVQKSTFIGLDRSEIRKRLGDYSGYYISGMYPTYLIQEPSQQSQEAWQLVFLIDLKGKIKDLVVHKNCCD